MPPVDPPALAIQRIRQQIEAGRELLKNRPLTEDASGRWFTLTKQVLVRALGSDHELVERFVGSGVWITTLDHSETEYERERFERTERRVSHLEAVIDVLKLDDGSVIEHAEVAPTTSSTRVFVVHGHDDGAKEAVARLLSTFDLEPVILHEQANQGRTLIEKLEAHSDVGFAVVLLTPDDHGAKAGEVDTRPRARQNVVLELGYFMGKLGRERVCALHKGGIELPSDYDGVVYTPFDDRGAWRFQLASELQAAGFDLDLNKLTRK